MFTHGVVLPLKAPGFRVLLHSSPRFLLLLLKWRSVAQRMDRVAILRSF